MFKGTANRILAKAFIVTVLFLLMPPSVVMSEYSKAAFIFESYDSTYPNDAMAEEYPLFAAVIPDDTEAPAEFIEAEGYEEEIDESGGYEEASEESGEHEEEREESGVYEEEREELGVYEEEREESEGYEVEEYEEEAPEEIAPASDLIENRADLVAAIAAANDGDTIVLGGNILAESHTAISINANITLTSEVGDRFSFTVNAQRHFIINSGSSLRLENVVLSGDLANTSAHGGIQVNDGGHLYLDEDSVIENSRATSGGGVQLNGGTLTINGGEIRRNTSTSTAANNGGGGVNAVGASSRVYMINGEINGNTAFGTVNTIGGGGVRIDGGQFLMEGGTISGNTITGRYGGGVAVTGSGSFTMEGGTISGNTARAGGGVNLLAGSFTMEGGTISSNNVTGTSTDDGGGGVRLHHADSIFYMYGDSLITDHEIARNGGGVRATAGTIYLRGGEISNNRVTVTGTTPHTGAGLHITNGVLTMSAGKISNNRTLGTGAAHGGGMHLVSSEFIMDSGEISGNWTSGSGNGGGIHMTGAPSAITMSGDAAIFDNEANQGGGLNIEVGAGLFTPFTMSSGRIEDNTARTNGGGMRISGAQLTMTGGMIHDNTAGHAGGGIHFATHALSRVYLYEEAVISENASGTVDVGAIARDGGGINMTGGRTYLRGGTIIDNIAYGSSANAGQGGGVNLRAGSTLTIEDGSIIDNEAYFGGGVSVFSIGTTFANVIMHDGEISGNTARDQGGGLNINQGTFEMFDGIIEDNTSFSHGGGMRMSGNGTVDIHRGEIIDNTASGSGGGIHIGTGNTGSTMNPAGGLLHIREDAVITENTASGMGGGVNFSGGSLRVHGTVSDNESANDGGGIEISSATNTILNVEVDGAVFSGNRSGGAGGAINTQRVNVYNTHTFIIQNTELYNNHARSRGGGMRLGSIGNLTLNNVTIHENSTHGNGGGIFIGSSFFSTLTLQSSVHIYENEGNHGGGLYQHGGNIQMNGAEIRDNTANVNGGGVTLNNAAGLSAGSFTMNDGIIYNNTARNNGGGVHARSGHSTFNMLDGSISSNIAVNGGGVNVGSSVINIHDGDLHDNTASNNGGGVWLSRDSNLFYFHGGEITDNRAEGDGGGLFADPTRADNPLINAVNVYPRIQVITDSVVFTDNTAGGGLFAPPENYDEITRFNGQLMTNYDINYRSDWRVVFRLNGGNINANTSDIVHTFQTSWTDEERTIGDRTPTQVEREGYNFLGWRHRDSEPERDEDWDGIFDIWSSEEVAEHVVDSSTVFEAVWERRIYSVTYMVIGSAPTDFTPDLDSLGGMYPMGSSVTIADGLTATTGLDVYGERIGFWRFNGWTHAEENLISGEIFTMPGEDVILVGTWTFEYPPRVSFKFHKTGEDLYNSSEEATPDLETILRSGAHFSLFRYTGDGTPPSGIVTEAMITAGTWEYVSSAISSGVIGSPIDFRIIPDHYYHIVETSPPEGYTLPQGQWRIMAVTPDSDEDISFRISPQGESTPEFVNIGGDFEDGAYFGGTFFVGNLLSQIPITGITIGSGIYVMILFGGLLITMIIFWYMKRKKVEAQIPR